MVSYKELGLTPTKDMYVKAVDGKYAVPGYNFNNLEQLQAIITACMETNSPVMPEAPWNGSRNPVQVFR